MKHTTSRLLKNSFWYTARHADSRSRRGFAAVAIATARNRNVELGLAGRNGCREEFFNSLLAALPVIAGSCYLGPDRFVAR